VLKDHLDIQIITVSASEKKKKKIQQSSAEAGSHNCRKQTACGADNDHGRPGPPDRLFTE
jgi:hypothetical protein